MKRDLYELESESHETHKCPICMGIVMEDGTCECTPESVAEFLEDVDRKAGRTDGE